MIILQVGLEISLPFIRNSPSTLLLILVPYLVINFLSQKRVQTIVLKLLIDIRHQWYSFFLLNQNYKIPSSAIFSKITYQSSLVNSSLSNIIYSSIEIVSVVIGLLIVSPLVGPRFSIFVATLTVFLVILVFFSFFISKHIINKERTLSTLIVDNVAHSLDNKKLIHQVGISYQYLDDLDQISDLDLHFRLQRNLLSALSHKFLFVLITVSVALYYTNWYKILAGNLILGGIVTKLIYTTFDFGLNLFPLKIGLTILIPQYQSHQTPKPIKLTSSTITFQSKKTKINSSSPYYKQLKLIFSPGDKILLSTIENIDLTALAKLFSGLNKRLGKAWIVKLNRHRYTYSYWANQFRKPYYVDPSVSTNLTLIEIITGLPKQHIEAKHIKKVRSILSSRPEFDFIFNLPKKTGTSFNYQQFSFIDLGLLELAHCLFSKPPIIVIDHVWIDLNHSSLNSIINQVVDICSESIIIGFTNNQINPNHSFDQTYQISPHQISKA